MTTNKFNFKFIVMMLFCNPIYSQLKVVNSGDVGVGTLTPVSRFNVMGIGSTFSLNNGTINSAAYIRGNNNFSAATTPDFSWYNNDQTGLFHPTYNEIGFSTGGTERLRITPMCLYFSNSQVAIYSAPLIRTTNNFSNASTPDYSWYNNDQTGLFHPANNEIGFSTGGAERMKINGNGQVAIGGAPLIPHKLTIYGSAYVSAGVYTASDERFKKNITNIEKPMEKIMKITGKIYEYRTEEFKEKNFEKGNNIGFIAQELKEVIPEAVKQTEDGFFSVNYDEVIPLLLEGIKEQQKVIETLNTKVEAMQIVVAKTKTDVIECCKSYQTHIDNNDNVFNSVNILYQNIPNPFVENTQINFTVGTDSKNSSISVFNMQGELLKTYDRLVVNNGKGNVTIIGSELKAGMYLYSLIVDGKEIDTKRMILTK